MAIKVWNPVHFMMFYSMLLFVCTCWHLDVKLWAYLRICLLKYRICLAYSTVSKASPHRTSISCRAQVITSWQILALSLSPQRSSAHFLGGLVLACKREGSGLPNSDFQQSSCLDRFPKKFEELAWDHTPRWSMSRARMRYCYYYFYS